MSLYDLLRRAIGLDPDVRPGRPPMARIEIISTGEPVNQTSGSRSPRA